MSLDLAYLGVLIIAAYQGYKRGLIVGIFSFFAVIIGLAAAVKLSAAVAVRLGAVMDFSEKILPFLSFILVFIAVIFLVRLVAVMIEKIAETMLLGFVNKLGGILMYAALYTIVFSVGLFYLINMNLLPAGMEEDSRTYSFLALIGPRAIELLGTVIPLFSDMFEELKEFFEGFKDNALISS